MAALIVTGGLSYHPTSGQIDVTPLVTVLAALLVVRFVLGVGLTWPIVTAVVIAGTALGWAIEAWGILAPTAVAFIGATVLTAPLHRRGSGGRPSSA
jgi:hypothetical protein